MKAASLFVLAAAQTALALWIPQEVLAMARVATGPTALEDWLIAHDAGTPHSTAPSTAPAVPIAPLNNAERFALGLPPL
jgi:hypothetical protein